VLCLLRTFLERYSKTTQEITETAVRISEEIPKRITDAISAGIIAIITSSIIDVVVVFERKCGDALTTSFLLISLISLPPFHEL
jgi:hypothetical protein